MLHEVVMIGAGPTEEVQSDAVASSPFWSLQTYTLVAVPPPHVAEHVPEELSCQEYVVSGAHDCVLHV